MTRLKADLPKLAIPVLVASLCTRHRTEWLAKISEAGVRLPGGTSLPTLDALRRCTRKRGESYCRSRKHNAMKLLRQIHDRPIRAVLLLALIQTPHRSAASEQLWPTAVWHWNTQQRGILHRAWPAQALQEVISHPRGSTKIITTI